jgi:hypothetical protein
MLSFITSLTFLYGFVLLVILGFSVVYYRDFTRSTISRGKFAFVFSLVALACGAFLWVNMHPGKGLRTFSNLEHHFIRHEGFAVRGKVSLGGSDTITQKTAPYNSFVFKKEGSQILCTSSYSDEPLFAGTDGVYHILSKTFPVVGDGIRFRADSLSVHISVARDSSFLLEANGQSVQVQRTIKKGISAYNLFRDDAAFIDAGFGTREQLVAALQQLLFIRENVSNTNSAGRLNLFFAGKFFKNTSGVTANGSVVAPSSVAFEKPIADGEVIAWGIGFLDNSRNQYRVVNAGGDSLFLYSRFPVSYPMTEEDGSNWSAHNVYKFLVSDSRDLQELPAGFTEGFSFNALGQDAGTGFAPRLLTYKRGLSNDSIRLRAQLISQPGVVTEWKGDRVTIPSRTSGLNWIFSVRDSFEWNFSAMQLSSSRWQLLIFGSLLFFVAIILIALYLRPAYSLSWVWQLLAMLSLVMLTTRFFLYWRYKSFPPYEGMDMPSLQQLNSFWNFGIIIAVTVCLALLLAGSLFISGDSLIAKKLHRIVQPVAIRNRSVFMKLSPKTWFFSAWLLVLAVAGFIAAFNHFDSGVSRHLSIILVLLYFLFVYISYRHSPLVKGYGNSWWNIDSNRFRSILISNPVKVLLSVSLLAVFAFIDIGFSIVFLNFLLFNEAFLCINYSIGGLSTGRNRNAVFFAIAGGCYAIVFLLNLLYAPWIFHFLLELPKQWYLIGYIVFALLLALNVDRVFINALPSRRKFIVAGITVGLFAACWFVFPKERVLDKAASTRYRIDVQIMPAADAIASAYKEGKTYEPVIRAAQNQWFINTFVSSENNPNVNKTAFTLLPHAPQNKGARYNAQATDLVTSRFLVAEHGKTSVLLYLLLLLLPSLLLASFYKLYPDFTNRINENYASSVTGFSMLNYLLISAMLVILAATGKYIFFGQDLPFGSILSKQSLVVPAVILVAAVLLFSTMTQQYYANRRKLIPGAFVFGALFVMLVLVRPSFNKNREFSVTGLSNEMEDFIALRLQPLWDDIDTSRASRRKSIAQKDQLFAQALGKMSDAGQFSSENPFFIAEVERYAHSNFRQHIDATKMLYLDLVSGSPSLAVNPVYFRVEPPPHLQQNWTGNVYGDSSTCRIAWWNSNTGKILNGNLYRDENRQYFELENGLALIVGPKMILSNNSSHGWQLTAGSKSTDLNAGDSLTISDPSAYRITDKVNGLEYLLSVEPDALMKNYFVNGARSYSYPLGNKFTWARHFAESIAGSHASDSLLHRNAFVSLDISATRSLESLIASTINVDTAYKKGAGYAVCVADGNGRLLTMVDYLKDIDRPDPNNKTAFNQVTRGDGTPISQSWLRKQVGNLNLLRLNPGPGSTLKPLIFSAVASQMAIDWDKFSVEGFSIPQHYYGSEKVAEYDFEKNNGRISKVTDYLKYSDNYYHSDVILLGSYNKQNITSLLGNYFAKQKPGIEFHWPYFSYAGTTYYLDGFKNWPGYHDGTANFGSDSSFLSIGLENNYGIVTHSIDRSFDRFATAYDTTLFGRGWQQSGFLLPEYGLFDQQAAKADHHIPYDLFAMSFRGHVKGSSQVMIPPVKMLEAFGRMVSQNRNYNITLNPRATTASFIPFDVDPEVGYANFLSLMRDNVFTGMKDALFSGTAVRLGSMLKNGAPYFYYAKTGTTGDNEAKTKSKLFVIVISKNDLSDPATNLKENKFFTIYFTSQDGPAKQNEELQLKIIKEVEASKMFAEYMGGFQK